MTQVSQGRIQRLLGLAVALLGAGMLVTGCSSEGARAESVQRMAAVMNGEVEQGVVDCSEYTACQTNNDCINNPDGPLCINCPACGKHCWSSGSTGTVTCNGVVCPQGFTCEDYDCNGVRECAPSGMGQQGVCCTSNLSCTPGLSCEDYDCNGIRQCMPSGMGQPGACCTSGTSCMTGLACCGNVCRPGC